MFKIATKEIINEFENFKFEKIDSYDISELIDEPSQEVIDLAEKINEKTEKDLKNCSKQQLKFYNDCSKLIFGELKDSSPVLIPAKCGFGKTTFLKSMISTVISEIKNNNLSEEFLPMIITQERLEDLKNIVNHIRKEHGYYNKVEQIDYIYLFKSWNKDISCLNTFAPKDWEESLVRCNQKNCKKFWNCELSKQMETSKKSPIIAFTTKKLGIITDSIEEDNDINNYLKFINNDKSELERTKLIIDEKPNFLKNESFSIDKVENLKNYVKKFNTQNNTNTFSDEDELYFEKILMDIIVYLQNLKEELMKYPFYILKLNNNFLTEEFENKWYEIFGYKHPDFFKLKSLFQNIILWNKSKREFIILGKNNFNTGKLKTFIFDGTADNTIEYSYRGNNFKFLRIQDYKNYEHLKFSVTKTNFSRNSLQNKPQMFEVLYNWIERTFKNKVYVITYQKWIYQLEKLAVNNKTIQKETEEGYPYFGNTKGKNTWSECVNMVQIGWNRYDSTAYISEFLSLNERWLNSLKEKFDTSENKEELIGYLAPDLNGNFKINEINSYVLKKMIVDFEQEVYRTNVREFTSDQEVNVYIFLKLEDYDVMVNMITERFPNCNIYETDLNIEIKLLSNKSNKDLKNLFHFLDNEWSGEITAVKNLKDKFVISDKKWSEQFTGKNAKGNLLFENRGIEILKSGREYFIMKKKILPIFL